jgi:hypothetical protein
MYARVDAAAAAGAGASGVAVAVATRIAVACRARRCRMLFRAALLPVVGAAFACPVQAAPAERTRPTAVESMAKVPVDDGRPTVRCWQYGRLVYEASNVQLIRETGSDGAGASAEPLAGGATSAGKGPRRVRVLDLRQGLCIVE